MKNKDEIIYNATALVSTWIGDTENIQDLRLVFEGDCRSLIRTCEDVNDAGIKLGEMLYENSGLYHTCKLLGTVERDNKEFGIMDIN